MSILFAIVPLAILTVLLRWAVFARLEIVRAPFCPVCREARGRILGVGERTSHPYFQCPHCGHRFDGEGGPRNEG